MFADIIEDHAAWQPDRPSLLSESECFSYAELAQRINRYARWALSAGSSQATPSVFSCPVGRTTSQPGSVSPRVGGVAALINTKLVGPSLSHCVNVAEADHVILASDIADIFETALPYLTRVPKIWTLGGHAELDDHNAGTALDEILDAWTEVR